MKIHTKLVLVAVLFSFMVTSLGLFGLWKSRDTAQTSLLIDRLHELSSIHQHIGRATQDLLLSTDSEVIEYKREEIENYYDLYLFGYKAMSAYPFIQNHAASPALVPNVQALHEISLRVAGSKLGAEPALSAVGNLDSVHEELMDTMENLDIDSEELTDAVRAKLVSISNETLLSKFFMGGFLLITLFIVFVINYMFTVFIYRPIKELQRAVKNVESGNLEVTVSVHSNDEVGELGLAFNNMSKQLHKRTEELEEARSVAEAATQAKSRFVGSMSHELRTPLNAVIGYSELLEEELLERGDVVLTDDVRKIGIAGRALLRLISDVLDLEKIQVNKVDLDPIEFSISRLLEELEVTAGPLAGKNVNKIGFINNTTCDLMFTDDQKIFQILTNLIGNACKFTENGSVTLVVSEETRENEAWVHFEVRDTGIGMSPEQTEKVFEAFTQADSSTTRTYGGTGLGLTISREFAELIGGEITANSFAGSGSQFTLIVPRRLTLKSSQEAT